MRVEQITAGAPFLTPMECKTAMAMEHIEDDQGLTRLISTAQQRIETITCRALTESQWTLYLDGWPACDEIRLPRGRVHPVGVQAAASINYFPDDDTPQVLDPATYQIVEGDRARILLKRGANWPSATLQRAEGIQIPFSAGWATVDDVPETIKQAGLLLVENWYLHLDTDTIRNTQYVISEQVERAVRALVFDSILRWP